MKWTIPIAVCFVVGCSGEVGGEKIEKPQQTSQPLTRNPDAPLDGVYSISDDSAGVWDLEWARLDPGARVFNRQPVPGAPNELFRLTWLAPAPLPVHGDIFKIQNFNSNLCITSGGTNIVQHECATGQYQYVDQWLLTSICEGACSCTHVSCSPLKYRISLVQDDTIIISLAPGASLENWQPLGGGTPAHYTDWNLNFEFP
jgi:hypothetical protein